MQGNFGLYIFEIPETLPKCPENETIQESKRVGQISHCNNVKGYKEILSCNLQISVECRIKFPPNCGAILGYGEVFYQICHHDLSQTLNNSSLMTYSLQTAVLDLSDNTIVKIDNHTFRGLENTQTLKLHNNLTTLVAHIFNGLINLQFLDIASNQIAGLNVGAFLLLRELKYLSISYNMLNTIRMHSFQNLINLETLYLDGNCITSFSVGVFVGLHNVTYLFLDNNLLTTLPNGIFQNYVESRGIIS